MEAEGEGHLLARGEQIGRRRGQRERVERGHVARAYSPRRALAVAADQRVGGAVVAQLRLLARPRSSGMIATARTLPSSTPHWSKESMPQIAPWVKTLCS